MLPKILRWLGREDAPLLFRPRADWAQWTWGLRFLLRVPARALRAQHAARSPGWPPTAATACARCARETGIAVRPARRAASCISPPTSAISRRWRAAPKRCARSASSAQVKIGRRVPRARAGARATRSDRSSAASTRRDDESGDAHRFTQRARAPRRARAACASATARTIERASKAGGGQRSRRAAREDGETLHADAYVVALGSYSPLLLAAARHPHPGLSAEGLLDHAAARTGTSAGAPTVSLTDEAHKIVISRLGNRLRAAGTAELAGYDTELNAGALRGDRAPRARALSRRWARHRPSTAGPGCGPRRRATCRSSAARARAICFSIPATARSAGRSPAARAARSPTSSPAAGRRSASISH